MPQNRETLHGASRQSATIRGNTVSPLDDGFDTVQEQGTALADILTGLGVDERYVRTEGTTSRLPRKRPPRFKGPYPPPPPSPTSGDEPG